ncbi:hypothetical protein ABD05_17980 [Burkholderia pyrrocinia]|nr:hypothetical protein ABD05_17980 [Burkholderia pyrrocinia]
MGSNNNLSVWMQILGDNLAESKRLWWMEEGLGLVQKQNRARADQNCQYSGDKAANTVSLII